MRRGFLAPRNKNYSLIFHNYTVIFAINSTVKRYFTGERVNIIKLSLSQPYLFLTLSLSLQTESLSISMSTRNYPSATHPLFWSSEKGKKISAKNCSFFSSRWPIYVWRGIFFSPSFFYILYVYYLLYTGKGLKAEGCQRRWGGMRSDRQVQRLEGAHKSAIPLGTIYIRFEGRQR